MEKGTLDGSILDNGLDVERWNRRKRKEKLMDNEEKIGLIERITDSVRKQFDIYYQMEPSILYQSNKLHFFELKKHLEVKVQIGDLLPKDILLRMVNCLARNQRVIVFDEMKAPVQENIIRFIFSNEELVWRGRGRQREEETIEQYLAFLKSKLRLYSAHSIEAIVMGFAFQE
jgi:hypothetical protein